MHLMVLVDIAAAGKLGNNHYDEGDKQPRINMVMNALKQNAER